jgi:hypothetical protein
MLNTSQRYKDMVYSKEDARYFVPEILLKIIDIKARESCSYTAVSQAFYSNLSQLTDEVFEGSFDYGTLEDGQFLLNETKRLMPDGALHAGQYGYPSESMSDENGVCDIELFCLYTQQVSTVGRVLYFDMNYDSVPEDFMLLYYRTGSLIKAVPVTGNKSYTYSSFIGVLNYDKLIIKFTKTSKPYRRIHLVEDIPGIYLTYKDKQIIGITLSQPVDIFSNELIAGEVDFTIENASKILDILNQDGFEKYLQRRQPTDIFFKMVFPDDTEEAIPIGKMSLVDWKSQKGTLSASFTARDSTDTLTLDEYIKGKLPATNNSMYELAEAVLIDAGIKEYKIDSELMNIYTTAPLPIASHKELLRMIAQASQSVVLPLLEGGLKVKYISPLVVSVNGFINPGFDNNFTNWTQVNCTLSNTYIYTGKQSCRMVAGSTLAQNVTLVAGHKYYIRMYALPLVPLTAGSVYARLAGANITANFVDANLQPEKWTPISTVYTANSNATPLFDVINTNSGTLHIDGFMILDLTTTYGGGNEPTGEWSDSNIRYFSTELSIPRSKDPTPVDTFDYSILLDAPEIATNPPVKSVETNIYSYKPASSVSEVYKGSRFISGTEEFTIKFNNIAKDCTIAVESLDASGAVTNPNTAVLLSSSIYAQAAKLRVTASSEVSITVNGKAVNATTSQFKIDSSLDVNLIADAKAESIDNKLITNKMLAEDVTGFAAYWYNRRYTYDFDWRQNPAIESLDTVTVYDDFNRNNGVMITERNINFTSGVLGGSSKGVY